MNFGIVFVFFLLIFLLTSGGHTDAWDGKVRYLLTENIVEHKSLMLHNDLKGISEINFDIKKYFTQQFKWQHNGEEINQIPSSMYIAAAPLLSIISIPFYFLGAIIGISETQVVPYFVNSIILALTSTTVFVFGVKMFDSKQIAFLLAIITSVCSFLWAYVDSFFQQPLLGLVLVSSCFFIYLAHKTKKHRFYLLGGILTSTLLLSHPSGIIFIPGILVYVLIGLKSEFSKIKYYFFGFVPTIALVAYLNFYRFGSLTDFGYGIHQGFTRHEYFEGIYGLIFSPGFGLIINFPLFVLFPVAIYFLYKKDKILSVLFAYIFIVTWIYFGTLPDGDWHGFGGWGPRYLVPIVPILVIPIGIIIKKFSDKNLVRSLVVVLSSIGFFVNLLGTLVWYQLGYFYGWTEFNKLKIIGKDIRMDLFQWDFNYIPVVLHWKVLNSNLLDSLLAEFPYSYWGECVPDIFLYCNFGLIVIIPMLVAIGIIGIFIIKNLHKSSSYQ